MDLNYFLIWTAGMMAVANFISVFRTSRIRLYGWLIVHGMALVLLATGLVFFPDTVGFIAGVFLGVFWLLPTILAGFAMRNGVRRNYLVARRFALIVKFLHPIDGFRHLADYFRALELENSGKADEAKQVLERLRERGGKEGQSAHLFLMRLNRDWEGIAEVCSTDSKKSSLPLDQSLMYVQALGETGRLDELMKVFSGFSKTPKNMRDLIRLYVYAFCGRSEALATLFRTSLKYPEPIQEFWLATSDLAAGRIKEGASRLESLKDSSDFALLKGIESREKKPLPFTLIDLTPESKKILEDDLKLFEHENHFLPSSKVAFMPYVTYALIFAWVAVFVAEELKGGSTSASTLVSMGAMVPPLVLEGAYWRIFAAQFLHYGWLHLAVNAFTLMIIGQFVERMLGRVSYLVVYLLSGSIALSTIAISTKYFLFEEGYLLVGASAGILGLVGAATAFFLATWIRHSNEIAKKSLVAMFLVIVLQTIFDLMTPQVSLAAHLGGAVSGFLITGVLLLSRRTSTRS